MVRKIKDFYTFLYSTFTYIISALLSKISKYFNITDKNINLMAKINKNLRRFTSEGIPYPSAGLQTLWEGQGGSLFLGRTYYI